MICCDVCKAQGVMLHITMSSDTLDDDFTFDFCADCGKVVLNELGDFIERLQILNELGDSIEHLQNKYDESED